MYFPSNLFFELFISSLATILFRAQYLPLIRTETYVLNYMLRKSSKSTSQSCTILYIYHFEILQNYKRLMQVRDGCLEENMEVEVRSRIISCRAQMMSFNFFCRINLSFIIYFITDNLSKALQAESISAVESQNSAKLSLGTLERMRSQENSDAFFDVMKSEAEKIDFLEEPSLPRKKRTLNYRTLEQYFDVQGLP